MTMKITRRKFLKYSLASSLVYSEFLLSEQVAEAYKPSKIVTEKHDIFINNLPKAFEGFTIAQISDLHNGMIVEPELIVKTIKLVNALSPDCIAVTGDFADGIAFLETCIPMMEELKAPHGVFTVMGNWEHAYGYKASVELFNKSSLILLNNKHTVLKKGKSSVYLLGVNDDKGKGNKLNATFQNLNNNRVKILLAHNPYVAVHKYKANKRIDLILAGHTHGGQVVYPFIGPVKLKECFGHRLVSGLYRFDDTQLYINRGIGVSTFPYRINCPPEITLITLKRPV